MQGSCINEKKGVLFAEVGCANADDRPCLCKNAKYFDAVSGCAADKSSATPDEVREALIGAGGFCERTSPLPREYQPCTETNTTQNSQRRCLVHLKRRLKPRSPATMLPTPQAQRQSQRQSRHRSQHRLQQALQLPLRQLRPPSFPLLQSAQRLAPLQ